jgi:hypothetical protein
MVPPLRAFLSLVVLLASSAELAGQSGTRERWPRALDGRRALGADTPPDELLALFRQPDAEDEAFLAELLALVPALEVLEETTAGLYRARELFEVCARGSTELDEFARAFQALAADPEAALAPRDARAHAFARAALDTRVRARLALLEGWRADAADLRSGLALLAAQADGPSRLTPAEVNASAARIDLAAALLRGRLKDLESLREAPTSAASVDPAELARLFDWLDLPDRIERRAAILESLATAEAGARRLLSLTWTARVRHAAERALAAREERLARAERRLADALLWRPDTPEGRAAPAEIARETKTTRRRTALGSARSGLHDDPLGQDLTWTVAELERHFGNSWEAASAYDRWLALRGIRAHDEGTWPRAGLDERERDAVWYVQLFAPGD